MSDFNFVPFVIKKTKLVKALIDFLKGLVENNPGNVSKKRKHFTMKNEGWGFKEDQIPSSSHLLHQTMGSQLHIYLMSLDLQIFGL